MGKKSPEEWVLQPKTKSILLAFAVPKTPRQVEKELNIRKLKLRPFLSRGLLKCLNDKARKGRFYVITRVASELIQVNYSLTVRSNDWNLLGRIMASPRQKMVVLLSINEQKRTSEEIRLKVSQTNPHLTRISTKEILNSLVKEGLVETELIKRRRFYRVTPLGTELKKIFTGLSIALGKRI